jgi:Ca-activated chloride channel family protein
MDFAHPHFAEPRWLWLTALAPLLLIALLRHAARERRLQLGKIAAAHFLEQLTRSHSPARRALKNVLLVLATAGLGLALARPQWGEQKMAEQQLAGEDIMFVMDCSRSMLASDVAPNRLERARLAIEDFVRRRGSGRVGLVAFAGEAFLQCPLTFDYAAFEESLRAVDDKTIAVPGTDVGRGLDEAFRAMEKDGRRKLMVLITDGEDLEKGGVKTAETLAKTNVVIFTIGVGTPAGAEIQMLNASGQPELLRDSKGEVVRSRLDEKTLTEIARATHGEYFPLGPLGEGLAKVRVAVANLNAAAEAARARKLGVDRFHLPLAAALILLAIEPLLGTRRKEAAR